MDDLVFGLIAMLVAAVLANLAVIPKLFFASCSLRQDLAARYCSRFHCGSRNVGYSAAKVLPRCPQLRHCVYASWLGSFLAYHRLVASNSAGYWRLGVHVHRLVRCVLGCLFATVGGLTVHSSRSRSRLG